MNYDVQPFLPFLRSRCHSFDLFITLLMFVLLNFNRPASSNEHSLLNTPPILYVAERNWRIGEDEPVGQILARVRAEDSENDELFFGLETHFHPRYGNAYENTDQKRINLPFFIDRVEGTVYLNESLVGRADENFFFYITVSDGQLTAKNEIFVNILGKRETKYGKKISSMFNVIKNNTQLLPSFDELASFQVLTNNNPSQGSFNNFADELGINTHGAIHTTPFNGVDASDPELNKSQIIVPTSSKQNFEESRTKLTRITNETELSSWKQTDYSQRESNDFVPNKTVDIKQEYPNGVNLAPILIAFFSFSLVVVLFLGYLFRKYACSIIRLQSNKTEEEEVKKSYQSKLSSNTTGSKRSSIILHNWSGPKAYGNRYEPCEPNLQQDIPQTSTQSGNNMVDDSSFCCGTIYEDGEGFTGSSTFNEDIWKFQRHRLKFFNILGEGAFGQVWRCEATDINGMKGVITVAVKTLKKSSTETDKKDLLSELEIMKSLSPHVNVVRFLGYCTDMDPILMIMEYVDNGKLQSFLRTSRAERDYGNIEGKPNVLTSSDLTSFMYQVAKGMEYLTSQGIIHRDLAARNVLIDKNHTCKVADFGLARNVVTSKVYERKSEGKLPVRWMAIESLYDNLFSAKSDIWSFGILMWEIVTMGSTPYPGMSAADVMKKVRNGYRLEKPDHCRRELYNIMFYCWCSDPNDRPSFLEIIQMLDKLLLTDMNYIELERFPDHNYYNIINLSGEKV